MTNTACQSPPFNGTYVGYVRCKGGTCVGGSDHALSCSSNADCTLGSCTGSAEELAQPNPCGGNIPPGIIVWDPSDASPDRATRSLRFQVGPPATATGGPGMDAIRVTMVDLQNPVPPNAPCCPPPDFSAYESATCAAVGETNGCARWVGEPGTFLENQDVPGLGSYLAARLQCTPFYFDWITATAITPITVVGAEITPSSTYSVQAYGAACMGVEAGCADVSAAVQMLTRRSGDVWPAYNPPSPARQPDGLDITVLINKFKSRPGTPSKAVAQLQPNLPELNSDVNAIDIVAVIDYFLGLQYAFSGPCPCPSLATCGAVACASPGVCTSSALPGLGAGAMCLKTCVGGINVGDACVNNTHCPGSTCGEADGTPGYCRDRCGRCSP